MNNLEIEKTALKLVAFGMPAVTLFLITGTVTDPVNAPKLFILGAISFGLLGLYFMSIFLAGIKPGLFSFICLIFLLWAFVVSVMSDSPFSQNFYGVYGRNTGLLTYACLTIVALVSSTFTTRKGAQIVVLGFLLAGVVNLVYGLSVQLFGDFIGWENKYGAILGTFGNPNFISAFLGILYTVLLAFAVSPKIKRRFLYLAGIPVTLWQLTLAESLQGLVVAVVGSWVVGTYWVYCKFDRKAFSGFSLILGFAAGVGGIFGALGRGPLQQIMEQPTVALREQYWYAALKMAEMNPIFGVGMDGYGDWYRRARGEEALISPGPETVTNAAHNVYLDLLSYGGIPLLALYIILMSAGLLAIARVVTTERTYDPVFLSITGIWITYQIQSIVSINQLGLAIWGWTSTGLLISYMLTKATKQYTSEGKAKLQSPSVFSPFAIATVCMSIGALISVPPLNADMKWRDLLVSQQISKLEPALSNSYLTPNNSYRLATAVQLLENSKLPDSAIKYARIAVRFNPSSFDAWRMLYYSTLSTPAEKDLAKKMMRKLDPLNLLIRNLP